MSRVAACGESGRKLDYLVHRADPCGDERAGRFGLGSFERYEVSPGTITFYLGDAPYPGECITRWSAMCPAPFVWRRRSSELLPAARIAVSTRKPFDVLPHGTATHDEYNLTPPSCSIWASGSSVRGSLPRGPTTSRDSSRVPLAGHDLHETVQALFQAALATGQNPRSSSTLRSSRRSCPTSRSISRSSAWRSYRAGEYERSFLVYRATSRRHFSARRRSPVSSTIAISSCDRSK